MKYNTESNVEKYFREADVYFEQDATLRKIQTITVDNYVMLGQLTALRFLEWVCHNPGGVVALPSGRTPEFFIKWMQHYVQNWERESNGGILEKVGLKGLSPDFKSLHFFQLDEFFPINPHHERSFMRFVKQFYLDLLGFDPAKTRLIDTYHLNPKQQKLFANIRSMEELFANGVDLSLRIKKPTLELEKLQQKAIRYYDQFCQSYEEDIRKMGGIGFFLGGIGPDGHIAFNVAGSSHFSHTRLTGLNYETEATAATDLGGIELVRKKVVITMGLESITYNPDTVAVIIAAGQAKSKVVANAIQKDAELLYPATVLQKLPNARFFITRSATSEMELAPQMIEKLYHDKILPATYPTRLVNEVCLNNKTTLKKAENGKLLQDPTLLLAEKISGTKVADLLEQTYIDINQKIEKGLLKSSNERFFHTAPHHDDIELAYFPLLHHLVRSKDNENHFVYCTSGFTAVTNAYLRTCFESLGRYIDNGRLDYVIGYENLFDSNRTQDDITGYLTGIVYQNEEEQSLYVSSRLARNIAAHLDTKDARIVRKFIHENIALINALQAGRKEPSMVKLFKGWLREFEAELVWAHFGIEKTFVHHLNLPFYSDDIFPQYPNESDVQPILDLMRKTKPTIITLALDPEGSGPDTHFKTLIALSEAIDKYVAEFPEIPLQVWGYRNVWSRFKIDEANMIVPISSNSFAVLHNMFNSCFLSQKSASFPSYEYDGTFSELAQKIWVKQHKKLATLMGEDYFYNSENPMKRRSYGAIYIKTMTYKEFADYMIPVRRLLTMKEELK
ncbi:MAG: 6-phosphogluconolactonase [Bacteroidales bacterium]|jgi:glucosamine-6-phosphate deaminase|nr:6-phosphogluconolactonase [Bacteroidales bacterium]